jgi:hypothetical protein
LSDMRKGWISRLSSLDKERFITVLSLLLAFASMFYAAWRDQRTEHNDTIRSACFDVLRELGALQTQLHYSYYEKMKTDPIGGWGRVLLIADLSMVIPSPVPDISQRLKEVWGKNWQTVGQDEPSLRAVLDSIQQTRNSILGVLKSLN